MKCNECNGKGKLNVGCIEEPDLMLCPSCNGTGGKIGNSCGACSKYYVNDIANKIHPDCWGCKDLSNFTKKERD